MDEQERREIRERQNFALSEAADNCDPEFMPDFSAKSFAPALWYSNLPAHNTLLALTTVPLSTQDGVWQSAAYQRSRYLRLNPFLKGKYVAFMEGEESTSQMVSRKGILEDVKKNQNISDWLEEIVANSSMRTESTHLKYTKTKLAFRLSFAGDWTSFQDRWWKFGPAQMVETLPKQSLFAPWDFTFFKTTNMSLTGGTSPIEHWENYKRPEDLGPIQKEQD